MRCNESHARRSPRRARPAATDVWDVRNHYFRRPEHVRLSVPASVSHTFRHFSLFNIY